MQPLDISAAQGQLPALKPVIVGFGERITMEETLESTPARVFGEVRRFPTDTVTEDKTLRDEAEHSEELLTVSRPEAE